MVENFCTVLRLSEILYFMPEFGESESLDRNIVKVHNIRYFLNSSNRTTSRILDAQVIMIFIIA